MKKKQADGVKTIATNRKAHARFSILESFEAGVALRGYEVKSLRQGGASIQESVVRLNNGELFLTNAHIPPYMNLAHVDYDPTRSRKLLMHRNEIDRLAGQVQAKGLTLVPLELYFKEGRAKLALGLAKGKKQADRREEIKKREAERDIRRLR